MKNMKQLMAVLTALGLSTTAAFNVIACGNPQNIELNDLVKSFASSYSADISNETDLYNVGLSPVAGVDKTFEFHFTTMSDIGINKIIKILPTGEVPVNKGITKLDPSSISPKNIKENDKIAQVTAKTSHGNLIASGDKNTVQYELVLTLWKANKDKQYVNQNITMDITVHINTALIRKNLSTLTKFAKITEIKFNTRNLRLITKDELLNNSDFKTAILNTMSAFDPQVANSEYTVELAKSNAGGIFNTVDLSKSTEIFIQFKAKTASKHLIIDSKTNWIEVPLPSANNINRLPANCFGILSTTDFIGVNPKAVTILDVISAIAHNKTLINELKKINSEVTDVTDVKEFSWIFKFSSFSDETITKPFDASIAKQFLFINISAMGNLFTGEQGFLTITMPKLS